MKTPPFWYPREGENPAFMSDLLLPASFLFKSGAFLRHLFAKPYRSRVPVICVGNVVAGGAGKTPTCLALANIFKARGYKPCFVTRGYGGQSSRVGKAICVNLAQHHAGDVGDEGLLLAARAPTWAGRNRAQAVRQAENYGDIIIMDDGLQNPHIAPAFSLLVVDGSSGLGNGRIVPAGPLRETLAEAASKADAMIVIGADRYNLTTQVNIPVIRARIEADLPMGFPREGRFVAFSGIARPEKFFATARGLGLDLAATRDYADHHLFSDSDIDDLRLIAEEQGARLLTTEKDAVRLPLPFRSEVIVLPVKLVFEGQGEKMLVELIGQKLR